MAIDYRKLTALRGPSIAGLLAALVVVLVGWALDRAKTERYRSATRADIQDRLSSARAHIEGLLNRRLYLVRALQAYPDDDTEESRYWGLVSILIDREALFAESDEQRKASISLLPDTPYSPGSEALFD